MRQEWSPEELLASWTLVDGDWKLVANKTGATRLGFSLLLKFFELEGRFPDLLEEVPQVAVEYVAGLVKVPAADFAKYSLTGRTAEYHRAQVREALGFRSATLEDEEQLTVWLAKEVCPVELGGVQAALGRLLPHLLGGNAHRTRRPHAGVVGAKPLRPSGQQYIRVEPGRRLRGRSRGGEFAARCARRGDPHTRLQQPLADQVGVAAAARPEPRSSLRCGSCRQWDAGPSRGHALGPAGRSEAGE
ncbi:DUF4158 domain-containing protein [Streptomyces sp. NPDC056697]|uniref:DUF4158 domain-containing protein n=1 Tax=Streptomyces sp. NPDC056697 TaxID=3345915 RepID=UPI003679EE4F